MIVILKKTGILLSALLLIAVTGGIPIYHHHCFSRNVSNTSIFLDAGCDENQANGTDDCCLPADRDSKASAGQPHCKCCNTTSTILKVQDSFHARRLQTLALYFVTPLFTMEKDLLQIEYHPAPVKYFSSNIPLTVSGKKILLEIHQLKLAPELG